MISESFFDTVPRKYCGNPCSTLSTNYGFPFKGVRSDQLAYAKFYFKTTTQVRKSKPAYDTVTLVAEFGGYLGLCLGVSLLDLSKVVKRLLIDY